MDIRLAINLGIYIIYKYHIYIYTHVHTHIFSQYKGGSLHDLACTTSPRQGFKRPWGNVFTYTKAADRDELNQEIYGFLMDNGYGYMDISYGYMDIIWIYIYIWIIVAWIYNMDNLLVDISEIIFVKIYQLP